MALLHDQGGEGRKRTAEESADFHRQLKQVNMLFLGFECLCIVDMQYLGRFWTQLESWLSYQKCEGGSLKPRGAHDRSRTTIKGIHSAGRSIEEALEKECTLVRTRTQAVTRTSRACSRACSRPPALVPRVPRPWRSMGAAGAGVQWAQAVEILNRPDVHVTNQKDKGEQLDKIRRLVAELSASVKKTSVSSKQLRPSARRTSSLPALFTTPACTTPAAAADTSC